MNGKHGLFPPIPPLALQSVAQVERQQSGLPVVRVHDIKRTLQMVDQRGHGFLEKHEPLKIVIVIPVRKVVEFGSVEEFIPANEINLGAG